MRHLSGSQWERLCGVLISILASVLFAVAENFMSEEDDEEKMEVQQNFSLTVSHLPERGA